MEAKASNNEKETRKAELKAIFETFDARQAGYIPSSKLGMLLRAAGETPTEAQVKELTRRAHIVSMEDFVAKVEEISRNTPRLSRSDVEAAFATFDPTHTGFVPRDELRRILTTLGEPLSSEEVDSVLQAAVVEDDRVDYRKLAAALVA